MVVALVLAQVLGQFVDALGQLRDLDLGVACVVLVGPVLRRELAFAFACKGHGRPRTLAEATSRARATSPCIASIRASTVSNRRSPRRRSRKCRRSSVP